MSAKSAFPVLDSRTDYDGENPVLECFDTGMTLRDYFAGQALMGFMASDTDFSDHVEIVAETAYKLAGAMLEAREKTV
jgi:hypothetical protein